MGKGKALKWTLAGTLIGLGALGAATIALRRLTSEENPEIGFVEDEILVKFQPGVTEEEAVEIHRNNNAELKEIISGIDVHVLKITVGQVHQKVAAYTDDPRVIYAEPNYIVPGTE